MTAERTGRLAIISDIHANLEALTAVLEDIKATGADAIYCLGDMIGYGPDPRECLQLAREKCDLVLCGNHEEAVLFYAEDFNQKAKRAIDWTRDRLNAPEFSKEENFGIWDFLGDLKGRREEGTTLFVHGSPRVPTREYLLPKDAEDRKKMVSIFELVPQACFVGHTHIAGLFDEEGHFWEARELPEPISLQGGKKIINVGSVGQPRDNDVRACYVLLEKGEARFRRVAYPVDVTVDKIRKTPALPSYLADRLKVGQ